VGYRSGIRDPGEDEVEVEIEALERPHDALLDARPVGPMELPLLADGPQQREGDSLRREYRLEEPPAGLASQVDRSAADDGVDVKDLKAASYPAISGSSGKGGRGSREKSKTSKPAESKRSLSVRCIRSRVSSSSRSPGVEKSTSRDIRRPIRWTRRRAFPPLTISLSNRTGSANTATITSRRMSS